MTQQHTNAFNDIVNIINQHGTDALAQAFTRLINTAMLIEREQYLNAKPHERSEQRKAYANGTKPKNLQLPVGNVTVDVPKTRPIPGQQDGYEPFYPNALERGTRTSKAVAATIAQMYLQGVSTRDVRKVLVELGLENVTSQQVSRAVAELDDELETWRNRPLGTTPYLILDARYEKVRVDRIVRDVAVLSAVGITPDGHRRVLGVSVALSEAEVHWRDFLNRLIERGLRGVEYVVSDDHAGLTAALRSTLTNVSWQRCQFHLSQNAIHHCPSEKIKKRIGSQLRPIYESSKPEHAEARLKELVSEYEASSPKLAEWLEQNIPEGLAVLSLPEKHRKRMRTSNGIERPIQQELKRRTRKIRIFPNTDSLLRLCTAILIEIDDEWTASNHRYLTWQTD